LKKFHRQRTSPPVQSFSFSYSFSFSDEIGSDNPPDPGMSRFIRRARTMGSDPLNF
jgi:hypothetical protein